MKSNRGLVLLAITLFIALLPSTARALDIPLLTWEKGKQQNLVLGGNTERDWKFELINEANEVVLEFGASNVSSDGIVVFSAFIPADLPVGAYGVRATGDRVPSTIVAGVNIVALTTYDVVQIPFELFLLLLTYIFVTVALSTMRIRAHGRIQLRVRNEIEVDKIPAPLWKLYRLRDKASNNLEPSLFQVVLRRDGDWLRARSLVAWCLTPVIGFIVGFAVGIQVLREGGLGAAPWVFIFIGAAITALDLYSGLIACVGFVMSHLVFGDIVSIRDAMVLLAVSLAWSGAHAIGLALYLLQNGSVQGETPRIGKNYLGITLGVVTAGLVFHVAQILVLSLIVVVNEPESPSWVLSAGVGLILFLKVLISRDSENQSVERSEVEIGRVISPNSVAFLTLFLVGTFFVWMRELSAALLLAGAFIAPYLLLLVRFGGPTVRTLLRLRRIPILESTAVTGIAYLIFNFTQQTPLVALDRSRLFLAMGMVPVLLHALYSMFWDISDRSSESTKPNLIDEPVRERSVIQ